MVPSHMLPMSMLGHIQKNNYFGYFIIWILQIIFVFLIYDAWAPMSPYKCNSQLNPKKTDVSQHEFGSKKVIKALMQAQNPLSHKHKAQNLKLET